MAEPGARPRLTDVAADVGLSPASVSLVLRGVPGPSEDTRARVLAAAARLGYRPDRTASLLARRRTSLLGVLMDVRSSLHAEMVEHIHDAAERRGYDVVLSTVTGSRDEQRAVEALLDFRCEAVLLLGAEATAARLTALAAQLPIVVVGRRVVGAGVDVVRAADDVGVRQAVDHLVDLGHTAVAFVDGDGRAIAADRRRGYRTAMRRRDLGDRLEIVPGGHTEADGVRAALALLARRVPPSAVVTFNDRVAVGVLDTCRTAGVSVPEELSVVGYDDDPYAGLAIVDLTTVSQRAELQAERAVVALLERLDGGRVTPRELVLAPHLVVRGTTALAPVSRPVPA